MVTFIQFLEEIAQQEVRLDSAEVQRMVEHYGPEARRMGNLNQDGSLSIPVDSILEAVTGMDNVTLNEAVQQLKSAATAATFREMLEESASALVRRVSAARKRKLSELIDRYQSAPDDEEAQSLWPQIDRMVFGS